MNEQSVSTEVVPRRRSVLGYWPVVLGAAAATFQIVTGVATDAVAITVAVAASCYLAAAALGQRWIAWAGVLTGSVVVTVSEVAGVDWWLGLSVYAVALVVAGLLRRASIRPLTAQGVAMLGFAGLAVVAVLVSPRLGLAIAGVALASHAGWDYLHWRRNEVVPRSLAEFCIVLDVPFGVAAIVLAFTT
ncbi:hypothetical protein [Kribbella shirazensis]|uniref:Uncharacterized protein n=1 Tax=Kribbella shirazensis TaxID=1105143 RepID=A0A7X6A387_9ACTN|nr:hypothetical protein [Kribbella shirazensis]NIK59074.1 hypothetical protein [Kribbella shirazensis]